jgi:leucyl-tRNA synthetase
MVSNDILDIEQFKQWRVEFAQTEFILENGKYICGWAVEKMSKSTFNVVNPDDIIEKYGADTLRMYEMFLGPLEQAKPWDTNGIDGVHKFLRKTWQMFYDRDGQFLISDQVPTAEELKVLHKTIKKIQADIEQFSFNTSVSAFMIAVNEWSQHKTHKRKIAEPFLIMLSPFAPHIAEELWHALGHTSSIIDATFPEFDPQYLVESAFDYPVSFNGKMRYKLNLSLDITDTNAVLEQLNAHELTPKYLEGKSIKKVVFVHGKIINVVIG